MQIVKLEELSSSFSGRNNHYTSRSKYVHECVISDTIKENLKSIHLIVSSIHEFPHIIEHSDADKLADGFVAAFNNNNINGLHVAVECGAIVIKSVNTENETQSSVLSKLNKVVDLVRTVSKNLKYSIRVQECDKYMKSVRLQIPCEKIFTIQQFHEDVCPQFGNDFKADNYISTGNGIEFDVSLLHFWKIVNHGKLFTLDKTIIKDLLLVLPDSIPHPKGTHFMFCDKDAETCVMFKLAQTDNSIDNKKETTVYVPDLDRLKIFDLPRLINTSNSDRYCDQNHNRNLIARHNKPFAVDASLITTPDTKTGIIAIYDPRRRRGFALTKKSINVQEGELFGVLEVIEMCRVRNTRNVLIMTDQLKVLQTLEKAVATLRGMLERNHNLKEYIWKESDKEAHSISKQTSIILRMIAEYDITLMYVNSHGTFPAHNRADAIAKYIGKEEFSYFCKFKGHLNQTNATVKAFLNCLKTEHNITSVFIAYRYFNSILLQVSNIGERNYLESCSQLVVNGRQLSFEKVRIKLNALEIDNPIGNCRAIFFRHAQTPKHLVSVKEQVDAVKSQKTAIPGTFKVFFWSDWIILDKEGDTTNTKKSLPRNYKIDGTKYNSKAKIFK